MIQKAMQFNVIWLFGLKILQSSLCYNGWIYSICTFQLMPAVKVATAISVVSHWREPQSHPHFASLESFINETITVEDIQYSITV